MAQVVQHNIMALNSYNKLSTNNSALSKNLEKLSSGYKINRAGDDAAGLAISEKMRSQITGLEKATANAQDGISLVQTAEGALTEVHSMLNRMAELATQSANGTYENEVDREALQAEVDKLIDEIDRISESTNFNGIKLLDGSLGGAAKVTTFANGEETDTGKVDGKSIGAGNIIDFTGKTGREVVGSTIKVGEVTFEFVTKKDYADAANTAVVVGNDDDASTVASKFLKELKNQKDSLGNYDESDKGDAMTTWDNTKVVIYRNLRLNDNTENDDVDNDFEVEQTGTGLSLQIGDTKYQRLNVEVDSMSAKALGISGLKIDNEFNAKFALQTINDAINTVSDTRATLGATQNRLEHTITNLETTTENLTNAESSIRDCDMAKEMMEYTKNNVLSQAAQAMLAQANQQPQQVLQLIQ